MKGYSYESWPTESARGGILLYTSKPRNESTFIEILNPKKTNVIVGCIYRHPHMDLNEFNDYYVYNLLDKLSKENKAIPFRWF